MRSAQFSSLQVLRAVAAIAVVGHHALRAVTVNLDKDFADISPPAVAHANLIDLASCGVDFFFVLSGFLMFYIAEPYRTRRRTIDHFIVQRIIRIWPLYALATLAALAPTIVAFSRGGPLVYDLSPLRLAGFLFVPSFDMTGLVQPILGVGWTLQYEALFYLCFAAALFAMRDRLLAGIVGLLVLLYGIGWALPVHSAAHAFLTNAILFEFLYGAAIASLVIRADSLDRRAGLAALAIGLVVLFALAGVPSESPYRFLARGLPAAFILFGMVSIESLVAWPAVLLQLGNASYSIYLVQTLLIYRVIKRVLLQQGAGGFGGTTAEAAAAAILVTVLAGVAVHLLLEKPLLRLGHAGYDRFRGKATPLPVAATDPVPATAAPLVEDPALVAQRSVSALE